MCEISICAIEWYFFSVMRAEKNLQQKRNIYASHLDPGKLTHFNEYFYEDSSSYPRKNTPVEKCQFTRIPMTRLNVSLLLQNISINKK